MAKPKRSKKVKRRKMTPDWKAMVETLGPIPIVKAGMTAAQRAEVAKARVRWQKQLAELIDQHRRRSRMCDVEALQETHSPTVEIAVDDPEATRKVRRNITRVRQSEAWRHNRLSGMQRDAEKEMEFAWRQRTPGLGAATSKYGILPPGNHSRMDIGSDIDTLWREWCTEAVRRRIMRAVVIEIFAEPKTLAQIERDRRLRRGQAMEHYILGLDLWCELRGWTRGPSMAGGPHLTAEGPTTS